jgi:hypothetical protein
MPATNVSISFSAGGVSISGVKQRSADSAVGYDIEIPQAEAGTLTTRTNTTDGIATLTSGHGIETNAVVDVYWTGGTRRAADVSASNATTATFGGGSGDNLPDANTSITLAPVVDANIEMIGNDTKLIGVQHYIPAAGSANAAFINLRDSGANSIHTISLASNEPVLIDIEGGDTNPLVNTTVSTGRISSNYTGGTSQLRLNALIDSTP